MVFVLAGVGLGLAAGYLISGFLAYGLTLAYFQREYPDAHMEDRGVARVMAFMGPIGLAVAFIKGDFAKHGFLFHPENPVRE